MTVHTSMRLGAMLRAAFQSELRNALGLSFSHSRVAALDAGVHRAAARMTGGSPATLLCRLRHREPAVMATLIDELMVGETYFFREPDQFQLVRQLMLATRSGARPGRLRLWSAGCASGEEPYTMAILAMEILGPSAHEMVEIIGTDVQHSALVRARQGLYRPWSFRGVLPGLRARWFSNEGERWRVCDQVRSLVRFAPLNLMDTTSPLWPRGVDLVFCRNVLMYLDDGAIERVCAGLRRSMVPDGWLITAPCDPLVSTPGLCVDNSPGFLAYRAVTTAREDTAGRSLPAPAMPAPALPAPALPAGNGVTESARAANTEIPDVGESPFSEALRLADQGHIAAALRMANIMLAVTPAQPAGYVLRATLYQSMNDHQGAVRDVQRALLLDRSLAFAHVLAAASRMALGDERAALHALRNARKTLLVQPLDAPVAGAQGITVRELLLLCDQLQRVLMRSLPGRAS